MSDPNALASASSIEVAPARAGSQPLPNGTCAGAAAGEGASQGLGSDANGAPARSSNENAMVSQMDQVRFSC